MPNPLSKIAGALKGLRREITNETLATLFDEAGIALDETNERYEIEIVVPETHVKVRLVDKGR